jgi:membrane protease YdiL (CAAX protease family)
VHWKLGLQEAPKYVPPLWAVTITVLRAGITEEVFYRGYALERLITLTGSKWAATVLTVIPFALFHFRQGPAGIMIAGLAALVLTGIYLKRRSLPAVILTHFTVDFIPNVLLPMFGLLND